MAGKKVLIVFSHNRLTGTTTFNWTLAKLLTDIGFAVSVHIMFRETKMTLVEDTIKSLYPTSFGEFWPKSEFDFVFFSDRKSLNLSTEVSGKRFFLAHGLGEDALEVTDSDTKLIDHLFSLSPFMNLHYRKLFPQVSQSFLPNFIDTNRFSCSQNLNVKPKKALLNDRRKAVGYFHLLKPIFKNLNIDLVPVQKLNQGDPIWNMENIYADYDLVLGYGRSIYEAMSCGRSAIVIGQNGADGFVDQTSFLQAFHKNASGWGVRKFKLTDPNLESIVGAEIDKFSEHDFFVNRGLIVDHLSFEKARPLLTAILDRETL